MNYDVIPTVCAAVVAVFAIQGVTIYAIVKAVVLGRALAERRVDDAGGEEPSRIVRPGFGGRP